MSVVAAVKFDDHRALGEGPGQSRAALMVASVPELTNRTCSTEGTEVTIFWPGALQPPWGPP